jgi:GNAT superfamily N-acetyltransferase
VSDAGVTVERVDDLDAAWDDLARLFPRIVEYHEPLTGERLQAGWEQPWREQVGAEGGLVLLARDAAGRAIGFATAVERRNPVLGTAHGALETAYVEAEWRRQGIGQRFVEAVEAWCRERGLARVELSVRAANADGLAAWRAMGFTDESYRLRRDLD